MRSDFFQEIAESRERFYSTTLGPCNRETRVAAKTADEPEKVTPEENQMPGLAERRRKLLTDFLGKVRLWFW